MPNLAVREPLAPLLPLSTEERNELTQHELVIDRGRQTFIEVGLALAAIRDGRLYRETHPDFQTYCQDKHRIGASRGRQLISAANVATLLATVTNVTPENEAQARELVPFIGAGLEYFWEMVVETAPRTNGGKPHVTAGHIKALATSVGEIHTQRGMDAGDGVVVPFRELMDHRVTEDLYERFMRQAQHVKEKLGLIDGDEWQTPEGPHLDAVRRVFGGRIDLDPCSTPAANKVIKAKKFFTKADDGLKKKWHGHVWLNPPFSYPLVEEFTARAMAQYEEGNTRGTIIVTNNATDATWCQALLSRCLNCFPNGRTPNSRTFESVGDDSGLACSF